MGNANQMTCRICGKPLTGEGAFLGIGPVCRKHRAEAMQLNLMDADKPKVSRREWEKADNFEIVNFQPVQETGKPESSDAPGEVIDWDQLRKPHED